MLQIQHILHPTDFSEGARAAFQHALHLARRHGATVHVLHVARFIGEVTATPYLGTFYYPDGSEPQLNADVQAELRTYVYAGGAVGVPVKIAPPLFDVPTASAILNYAGETDTDLIVMGTHGRRGVMRALLGSVAEGVLRRAPCPVLTVRTRHESGALPEDVHRVLVPVDLDFFAAEAVQYGAEIAALYEAKLALLHVVDVAADPDFASLDLDTRDRHLKTYEALAHERLRALADIHAPTQPLEFVVRSGDPWEDVASSTDRTGADLVVMPSHGLTGLRRLVLGSIAERMIREAQGAVFVVKPSGKSLLPREPARPAGASPCCGCDGACKERKQGLVQL